MFTCRAREPRIFARIFVLAVLSSYSTVQHLGRDGPRNSIVNYTLFPGRSVVVAQTVDSIDGVTFKSRSTNYSEGEGVRTNNTPLSVLLRPC